MPAVGSALLHDLVAIVNERPKLAGGNVDASDRLWVKCPNTHWCLSLEDARAKIEVWRQDNNHSRPSTSLRWLTPIEFAGGAAKIAAE